MKQFSTKTAFVAGGSKGIGYACALRLAEGGANVFLAASNEERLETASAEISRKTGVETGFHAADLRELENCLEASQALITRFGGCDILINSAGATRGGIFPEQPDEEMLDGFALKFHAAVRLSRLLWPALKKSSGCVVNIVGGFARTPASDFMVGGAVNAALANFTKALADQGLKDDVNVNWIHPGLTETERLQSIFEGRADQQNRTVAEIREETVAIEGLRRLGKPEDVAALVAFLCDPQARHIHGTGIALDGGGSKGYY
jgi:3-oxoacyl-[acyl-carrier protein] reductase